MKELDRRAHPQGDKGRNTIKEFRPISLTLRLDWYLENRNAFHPAQTGFRAGLGTQEVWLSFPTPSSAPKVDGKITPAPSSPYIDVSRAVDSVPHSSIITAAAGLGISGRALNFIRSFLANRTLALATGREAEQTQSRPNRLVVPQGSVLSLTLF